MAALARRLKKLTEEQLRVIRQLQYLRRVRVSGIAGSGKTLVAAEKAIRLANERNKTLFLCHNPMLADYVSELTLGSGVAVEAFTEWVTALAGAKTISESSWSKIRRADERTSGLRI